jgi:DNA repair exonuclease SbcCD nuclease subunit
MVERLEHAGIHTFYTTGNHDPYQDNEFFKSLQDYRFIHPFYNRTPETIEVEAKSGQVYTVVSAGHDHPAVDENVIKNFPQKEGHKTFIGIGHTMVAAVQGSVDHGNYMPCSLEELRSKNYDYFALGHIHKAMALDEEGRIRYAGNIQGRHINETGPKGGWLIELDQERFKSTFVPFHDVEWQQVTIELRTSDETMYDILQKIKVTLDQVAPITGVKSIYRIHLSGETPLYDRLQLEESIEELEESIEAFEGVLEAKVKVGGISPVINREELKQGEHFLGSFLKDFDEDRDQFKKVII